jgi:hypothetical protein
VIDEPIGPPGSHQPQPAQLDHPNHRTGFTKSMVKTPTTTATSYLAASRTRAHASARKSLTGPRERGFATRSATHFDLDLPDVLHQVTEPSSGGLRLRFPLHRAGQEQAMSLHEKTAAGVGQLPEPLETRFNGMDRAIRLHAEIIDRVPAERDMAIKHLEELHDEKFGSIAVQFAERDVRSEQASEGAKRALDAALLAQKELVAQQNEANSAAAAKAEASFTKQIDQIGTIIQTQEKALDARITELKERIDRAEGSTEGAAGSRSDRRLDTGQVLTTLSVIAAVIGLLILAFRH